MKYKLLTPGPVSVPDIVLREMARPIISHRDWEFRRLLEDVVSKLMRLFGISDGSVALLSGTGTTAVDAMIWSLVGPGDKVLALSHGEFGDRMVESLSRAGAKVEVMRAGPGDIVWPERVVERLDEEQYNYIALVHNETSTGTAYKLQLLSTLATAAYRRGVGLLVDTVSGLGGEDFAMHKGIWAAASCSHKALAAPPGVSFIALSPEALEILRKRDPRAPLILDLRRYVDYMEHRRETPYTPPIPQVYALNRALDLILERGVDESVRAHQRRAEILYSSLDNTPLKPVPLKREIRSNTVVALWTVGVSARLIRERLREKGYIIASGMGRYRDKMIRIGVMGALNSSDIIEFTETLKSILADPSLRSTRAPV